MNKRQLISILLILGLIPVSAYAQRWKLKRYEANFSIGTSNFYGDIGGTSSAKNAAGFKDIQLKYTRPSFALGARYKLTGDMAVRMNLIYGFVAGNDVNSRNDGRKYSFTSTIFEPSFQFEYYLIPESRSTGSAALFNRRGMVNNYSKIYVYLFGGIGGVFGNPKLKDSAGNLMPTDNFSKFGIAFPVGAGLKYTIDSKWSIGLEFGRRFTTTDYIDGYTSEFSKHKDLYDFGMVSAIYKIRTDRRGFPILGNATKYRR
jgi:opacity protein-like surface antigen